MRDLRYALRALRRQPLFTAVAVATLALGIGANTAIFSLLYQVLLGPLPYAQEDRLVFVWNSYPKIGLAQASVSIPDYLDRIAQAPAIEDATLFSQRGVGLSSGGGEPEQVRALRVTPSFFSTLGRAPALGRVFTEAEATPDGDRFVILTDRVWRARFGGNPSVVGTDTLVDGVPFRIVGVLARDFELPTRDIGVVVPYSFTPNDRSDNARGNESSAMIARLRPGATPAQLEEQMRAIVARNAERLPQFAAGVPVTGFTGLAVPIRQQLAGDVRAPLLLLQAGVVLVLLIACVNVANLLLMRATGRQREVAIRTAIGAGRGDLVRQMLVEGLVLSSAGAITGLALGLAAVQGLIVLAGPRLPGAPSASLNLPMALFAVALALITGVVFGLVPAAAAWRADLDLVLRDDGTRGTAGRGTGVTRTALVVTEVALAVMLLVGAGLLLKSYARVQEVDPGFSTESVLTAQLALPASRYPDPAARAAFWTRLVEATRRLPGVTSAGLTSNVPFNGMVGSGTYRIVGYEPGAGEPLPHGRQEVVGGDYFAAMKIPLKRGRVFTDADGADSPRVVVIDEYLVGKYFKDKDPIGQQIRFGGATSLPITVIGVVGTINSIDLAEPVTKERLYYPVTQQPRAGMAVVLKTAGNPGTLVAPLRAAIQQLDPAQALADVRTLDQWIGRSLATRRAPTVVLGLFGAVAVVLSAIGIYGVVAFGVAGRLREFAIRQALGAAPGTIVSLVLRQGVTTAAIGVVLGLAGAVGLSRYLESLLYGVSVRDSAVLAGSGVLLLGAALIACYLPARGSTRRDPAPVLRDA